MFALILPTQIAALPNVSPSVAPADFGDSSLEGKFRSLGIGFSWRWVLQHIAKVNEMLLRRLALSEFDALPFGYKLGKRECGHGSPRDG